MAERRVGLGRGLAEGEELHPCLMAVGCIALLVVGADCRVELVHGAAILVVLEYGLMVELASSGHEAAKDNSLGLLPKGDVCGSHLHLIGSGCRRSSSGWSRVLIDCGASGQGGCDDAGMILGAGEIRHDLHIPVREVVFCEDQEAGMSTVASGSSLGIRHSESDGSGSSNNSSSSNALICRRSGAQAHNLLN